MTFSTADTPLVRVHNARAALDLLRREAPLSRVEIARRLGTTRPTGSAVVTTLVEVGLVREVPSPAAGGRGALYEPVAEAAHGLALDVGGRVLRLAVTDLSGRVVARRTVEHHGASPRELAEVAVGLRDAALAEAGLAPADLSATVVGVPGVLDPRSHRLTRANPDRAGGPAVADAVTRGLGHEPQVENDINLAALGERASGRAQGVDDFAFLSVGTGVGSGLVLGGALHRGRHGAAGELELSGSEGSAAEHALLRLVAEGREGGTPTSLAADATPADVFEAAAGGDPLATAVLGELAARLARHIGDLARVVDLELVVLGGGIGSRCAGLLDDIETRLHGTVLFPPRLAIASLHGSPVLDGAVSLATASAYAVAIGRLDATSSPAPAADPDTADRDRPGPGSIPAAGAGRRRRRTP
ncbi:ROK family transcriptional regulator [Phycicoccus sonneratiae]|uniref:ROK family transcriptional regulator n=1 Tax=Phycicoccus sonneratiae TaxID=2807628 RepID=A0ABS2CJF9_9MICO|nr:ROK family transcriptional regulator [Phycicoccus sonneraticus]MBM6400025.1 ROK family transcriptional regulator [Phycicoccus sonneraticus]